MDDEQKKAMKNLETYCSDKSKYHSRRKWLYAIAIGVCIILMIIISLY
jgi:hypothetical protein